MSNARRLIGSGIAVGALAWMTFPAAALPPEVQSQIDQSFREVLRNPGDTAVNRSYAEQLIEAGDYEKAVATLERILIDDPAQSTVRFEIAVLYFRLGSYEASRAYFQRALADPTLPADLRARGEQFLADIADRLSRQQITGFGVVAGRWQSNANTGPDPVTLRALGTPISRPPSISPKGDFDFFGAGNIQHSYDLDTQNDAHIVSTLIGYGDAFSRFSRQDLVLGELTSGIRFKPDPLDLKNLQIRPHVIANYVSLDGNRYESTYGFGLDVTYEWSERLATELTLEYRRPQYGTIASLGDNQLQSGDEEDAKLRVAYQLSGDQVLLADLLHRSAGTKRGFYDFDQYQATLMDNVTYRAPVQLFDQPSWTVAPYLSWYSRDYGGPDPSVSPASTRLDNIVMIGINHTIPITGSWSAIQSVTHTWADSNVPNYTFQDTTVLVGLQRRF